METAIQLAATLLFGGMGCIAIWLNVWENRGGEDEL